MRKIFLASLATAVIATPSLATGPDGPDGPNHRRRGDAAQTSSSDDSGGRPTGGMRAARGGRGEADSDRSVRTRTRDGDGNSGSSLGESRPRGLPSWRSGGMEANGARPATDAPRMELPGRPGRPGIERDDLRTRPTRGEDGVTHDLPVAPPATAPKEVRPPRGDGSFATPSTPRHSQHKSWTRTWRDDHRYDWRSYRNQHRSKFRFGIYYDPYGYRYRRWLVGWNMRPYYYRQSFWLNDPWQYRLPEVWGPYRWVRYYDDAVLVDTFTGEVVDVIYNFFW